jgi:hypothetical protein
MLGAGLCESIRKRGGVVPGKTKLSLCELAHMEDSSFFREQAEMCRRQARDSADPMLQITLETLAFDCIAYADELDYPDDCWFANKTQTETEPTPVAQQKSNSPFLGTVVLAAASILVAVIIVDLFAS